ncbi:hypothetical protein J4216_06875 [Candidatus Woesearchaeota archaeon]|nr:hypothetical protein [Candidatus Woesearchaeota archaeon]
MEFVNLILFFIYTFGIGFTISSILKLKYKDYLEITFINIGLGLAGFLVVGVLLNLLHIPLDWKIFLLISLIGPLYWASKNYNKIFTWNFNFPKKIRMSNIFGLIVLALFLFTVLMYSKGAFSYPWLEDGDPWTHLMGVKYISEEKTVFEPVEGIDYFFYIDPYPPGFDMLLGVMNQTSGDIVWTLKFFNILIISLAIPFSYFFFGKLTKSSSKALIGTFILAVLPSFMSHFIWAHSLAITLVPLIFYAALSIEEDHKWSYAAALFLGSSTLVQPTQPIKFIALFIIFSLVKSFSNKGIWKQYTKVLFIGGILGLLWWGPLILQSGGLIDTAENFRGSSIYVEDKRVEKPYYGSLGTATRFYHWQDFFLLD